MLTRCPDCGTTFRVTAEQLKIRSGRVRCGECQHVFNALETLAEETLPPPPAAVEEQAPSPGIETPEETVVEAEIAQVIGESAAPQPENIDEQDIPAEPEAVVAESGAPEAQPEAQPEVETEAGEAEAETPKAETTKADIAEAETTEHEPETAEAEPQAAATDEPQAAADELEEAAEEPVFAEPVPPARKARAWPWLLGIFAASLLLAVQAVVHFRTEIATLHPDTRPMLASACDLLGCILERPRKPELVGIEASDLSVAADGRLALTATLRNRAPFAQEYPHLELTLTDTADKALVRRVLAPPEYLPQETPAAAGFAPRADVALNLAVSAPGVPAAGYRLYLFYP